MMGWNYRMLRHTHGPGEEWLAIHEVYYDEKGNVVTWTEDPSQPIGDTVDDLRWDLEKMLQALDHPVIEVEHKLGQNGCGND